MDEPTSVPQSHLPKVGKWYELASGQPCWILEVLPEEGMAVVDDCDYEYTEVERERVVTKLRGGKKVDDELIKRVPRIRFKKVKLEDIGSEVR